jgi:predicted O-linked N-acetylglucosamine transferase (SPINDLY family)
VVLASNLETLARLRSSLRERLKNSSLTDGARLAAEIEAAYREIWRLWCESGASEPR